MEDLADDTKALRNIKDKLMRLTKRQINRIIREGIYRSKNYEYYGKDHQKRLDFKRAEDHMKSPAYYESKMSEYAMDLLQVFIDKDEEEYEYYAEELGTDDVEAIVEIYEGLIQKLRSLK